MGPRRIDPRHVDVHGSARRSPAEQLHAHGRARCGRPVRAAGIAERTARDADVLAAVRVGRHVHLRRGGAHVLQPELVPKRGDVVHLDRHHLLADPLVRQRRLQAVLEELDHAEHVLAEHLAAHRVQRVVAVERLERLVNPEVLEVVGRVAAELRLQRRLIARPGGLGQGLQHHIAEVERVGGFLRLLDRDGDLQVMVRKDAVGAAFELIEQQLPENGKDQNIAIVDVGTAVMNMNVLRNGQSVYMREQPFGGNQLTQEIQRVFGMSPEEAEAAKRAGGLPDNYESEVLLPFLDTLGLEVARAMQFFFTSTQFNQVNHIVMAGGCAAIPGIDEVVARRASVSTMIANPFANMALSSKIRPKYLTTDAPSLMVACGLAMRRFDA